MLENLLFGLWFLLPAGLANMAPVIVAKAPFLKQYDAPIDFGKSYKNKRIFGSHKTWRGLIAGIVVATLIYLLQLHIFLTTGWGKDIAQQIEYTSLPLIIGALMGLGALGGDAVESFFKRQSNVKPGQTWIPFDQIDYIIGAVIITLPFVILSVWQYISIFIVWFGMHLLSSFIGWKLGLKDAPI